MGTRSQIAFLLALTLAIYLSSAFRPALLDDADSVHAEAAREILERGDWVTLYANGIRYLEKAPLMYWAMAGAFRLLGVWELPARLPLVLGTLALVLTLYAFGRFLFGERTGFYAGLGGATCFGIYLFTRILIPEVLLALFITGAFFFFLAARKRQQPLLYYGMYVCLALAVLTKGLIGVILPAGIVGAWALLAGSLPRTLREMRLAAGTLILVAIAAPWHILAGLRNEKFFWFYFMNEQLLRYLGKRIPVDYDTVPLPVFLGLHLVWLFPWTPFLVLALRDLPRVLRPRFDHDRTLLFLWLWAGMVLLFFSFSTRQEYYSFAAYPALILLAAKALEEGERLPARGLVAAHWALLAVAAVTAAVLGVLVALSLRVQVEGDIAATLTRNPQYYALSLGHFFDLTPASFAALRWPAVGAAVALLAGSWLALHLRRLRRNLAAGLCLALMAAAFFFCAHAALNVFSPHLSSRGLADAIAAVARPGDRIVINGEYESGSTLNFYTGRRLDILNGRSANLWWGSFYPDAPRIFLEDKDLVRLWQGHGRIFLVTEVEKQPALEKLVGKAQVFTRSGGKVVLLNR